MSLREDEIFILTKRVASISNLLQESLTPEHKLDLANLKYKLVDRIIKLYKEEKVVKDACDTQ